MKKIFTVLIFLLCLGTVCRAQENGWVESQSTVIVNKHGSKLDKRGHYPSNAFDVHISFSNNSATAISREKHYYVVVGGSIVTVPDEIGEAFYWGRISVELVKWYNKTTNEYKYTIRPKKVKNVDLSKL